jgi:hypothetical protein
VEGVPAQEEDARRRACARSAECVERLGEKRLAAC